jgi:hypothetical protein
MQKIAFDEPGDSEKHRNHAPSPPEDQHGQRPGHTCVALACSLLPGTENVSASQADGASQQQHPQRRQQLLFEIASGLEERGMQDRIERENAEQQRSEFCQFQKHGKLS